jgi:hypothetical protein
VRLTRTACCDRVQRATDLVMALNIARYERKEDRRRLSRWLDLPCTKKPLAAPSAYGGFLRRYTTIPPSASPLAVHFATALSAKQHLQGRAIRSAMGRAPLPKRLCCRRLPSADGNDVVGQHWRRCTKLLASDRRRGHSIARTDVGQSSCRRSVTACS